MDGFEIVLQSLLEEEEQGRELLVRVVEALGEEVETGVPSLTRLPPEPARVAASGAAALAALDVPPERARAIVAVAHAIASGAIRLEPGRDIAATHRALVETEGVGQRLATMIVMRALYWPDAFPASDPALQCAAGARSRRELQELSERWRPWRAYAAQHLWLSEPASRRARPGALAATGS
jgi:AraC family transcriptional regulator of adaptative response / DNA-3-methyladenine glycosylase II